MTIQFKEIPHTSKTYQEALKLREKVLRNPLGLKQEKKDLISDADEYHLGAFEQQKLVGCVSLRPINRSIIKLRQMGVDFSHQGQGIGIYLLQYAEKKAANLGFKEIQLNARYHVQGFYEKCGYQAQGGTFLEVTIPHIFMTKKLSN